MKRLYQLFYKWGAPLKVPGVHTILVMTYFLSFNVWALLTYPVPGTVSGGREWWIFQAPCPWGVPSSVAETSRISRQLEPCGESSPNLCPGSSAEGVIKFPSGCQGRPRGRKLSSEDWRVLGWGGRLRLCFRGRKVHQPGSEASIGKLSLGH